MAGAQDRSATTPAYAWLPGTIRARMLLLTISLLLPAVAVASLLLWRAYDQEHGAAERQLADTARALSMVVDRQIGQSLVLLDALAASEPLVRGDVGTFDTRARAANRDPSRWILLIDERGRQVVNTSLPPGSPMPRTRVGDIDGSFRLMSGDARLWTLIDDPISGEHIVVIGRTITPQTGAPLRLAVVTPARAFVPLFHQQGLTGRYLGALVDGSNTIVARSRGHADYVGRPASAAMQDLMRGRVQGVAPTTTLDGVISITAWNKSPLTGWTFLVAVPRGDLAAGARDSLVVGAMLGLILLGLGALISFRVGRSVSRPIEQLAAQARALGHGEDQQVARARLVEVKAVQDALHESARELLQREADLQTLNQTLERRVIERTRELAEATDNLVQAQKMEAIGRLTGGIAHDFNNLLTAILGNIDLIQRRTTDERTTRQLTGARQAAERGAKLTGQLLAFSRRQHLKAEAVDVGVAIENAVGLLRSTLGAAIVVEHVASAGLWTASADPTQLDLILLNLAINARDAMPAGGTLQIVATNVTRGPPTVPEEPGAGDYVAVTVADRGTGMAPETLGRVFEPFFTTKPVGQGTGLGLPQVLGVLKQLGGGISIDSRVGDGTSVTIYLPRSNAALAGEAPPTETGHPDLRGLRVLLVDDDPDVRGVAAALLRELGCHVAEMTGGSPALEAMRGDARFDFVLLDFAMPGMNGAEVAREIRAHDPEMPILLMSGFADVDALSALWEGPLLPKPFTAAGLEAGVAEAVTGHRVVRLRTVRD